MLVGALTQSRTRKNAATKTAIAFFITSSRMVDDPVQADAETVLEAIAIAYERQHYVQKLQREGKQVEEFLSKPFIHAMVLQSQAIVSHYFFPANFFFQPNLEKIPYIKSVMCQDELKMELLARTCLVKGFTTLIGNLIRSVSSPQLFHEEWLDEYLRYLLTFID
jgi:hypothetical protein